MKRGEARRDTNKKASENGVDWSRFTGSQAKVEIGVRRWRIYRLEVFHLSRPFAPVKNPTNLYSAIVYRVYI